MVQGPGSLGIPQGCCPLGMEGPFSIAALLKPGVERHAHKCDIWKPRVVLRLAPAAAAAAACTRTDLGRYVLKPKQQNSKTRPLIWI